MSTAPPRSAVPNHIIADLVVMASNCPEGPFVEVGVWKGGTAWHLNEVCKSQGRKLHLFDTFRGHPWAKDGVDRHPIGDFGDTSFEAVHAAIPDAVFHVGIFPQTLPSDLWGIAFAHIDCDQYESIQYCVKELFPRLVTGGIMAFDDYDHVAGARASVTDCLNGGLFRGSPLKFTARGKCYVVKEGPGFGL